MSEDPMLAPLARLEECQGDPKLSELERLLNDPDVPMRAAWGLGAARRNLRRAGRLRAGPDSERCPSAGPWTATPNPAAAEAGLSGAGQSGTGRSRGAGARQAAGPAMAQRRAMTG